MVKICDNKLKICNIFFFKVRFLINIIEFKCVLDKGIVRCDSWLI